MSFSAKAVAQTRFQFSRLTPAVEAVGGATSPVVLITINDSLPSTDPAERSGTLVAGSSTTGATDRRETRFQVQEIFSYLQGSHSLKFGADVQRISSTFIDLTDFTGTFSFRQCGRFSGKHSQPLSGKLPDHLDAEETLTSASSVRTNGACARI